MRTSLASQRGLTLKKSPNSRQEASRRRFVVACAFVVLALASGAIGMLTHTPSELGKSTTGPFSYFPTE